MRKIILLLMMAAHLSACATYESRSVSFRPPQDYVNYQDVAGMQVGAEAFADKQQAEDAFGFNIRDAGLLPVLVVIDNKSGQGIEVVSGQTFLIDSSNRYWKLLSNREAVERVDKATQAGSITSGAGKGAAWGAATGALLGLAIGIVSGHDAGSALVKGGVLGGVGGAVIGGASKGDDREREYKIADDVREKGMEGKIMAAEALASGFIFFPGEAESVRELRLQVRFRESGTVRTLNLRLK
ncbi:glycine zipper family protein [Oryzomonas sagensis]|uniref:Glycine zipper family protein n=1 Tax=Oryzomonas sagensis TaxID=2603857 RepID=A0ABQ6TRT2_9BACT|nr:glycine zipper family protein [Oryzomonas sagensis]KAB0671620.1 glycine zipper family protein [Oryzomonas sagensis]